MLVHLCGMGKMKTQNLSVNHAVALFSNRTLLKAYMRNTEGTTVLKMLNRFRNEEPFHESLFQKWFSSPVRRTEQQE